MPMNPRKLVPTQEPGILDFAPGAAAAYSLRNLSLSYAGPVVTVRRSTDNAEADFTASEVSDGTLAGWAGADGFVKQWWDQSGNARHATQATATAQPQIVDSGVLVAEGGKAAVQFDGVDDTFDISALGISGSQNRSVFACLKPDAAATGEWFRQGNNLIPGAVYSLTAEYALRVNAGNVVWGSGASGGKDISTTIFAGSTVTDAVQYINGAVVPVVSFVERAIATEDAGNRINSGSLSVTFHELIIYPTDMTDLRTRIEGNINRRFGVF